MANLKRWVAILLVLVISLILPGAVLAADDEQSQWFLSDDYLGMVSDPGAGIGVEWEMYTMYQGNSTLPEGIVEIAAGDSCIWRADVATPEPAPFATNPWKAKVMLAEAPPENEGFDVYVGYILGGVFTSAGLGTTYKQTGQDKLWWFEATIEVDGPFTVPAGGYLAFKIDNTTTDILGVRTGQSCSWLKPQNDPAYPVPELPAAILLGVGLLGLVGYLGWRRRKVSSIGVWSC